MNQYHGVCLSWELIDSVLEVELHRGPCNEIGTTTLRELELLASFVKAGAGGARAMITYSTRRGGFSAGADLRELYHGMNRSNAGFLKSVLGTLRPSEDLTTSVRSVMQDVAWQTAEEGRKALTSKLLVRQVGRFLRRIHAVFNTLDEAPFLTIAATHGVVFGGGFELALVHDIIIADKSARFAFPELRLGLVPGFGGIPRLERDVGNAVVRDLLLTGRSLNARRAHAVGLVSQVTARDKALTAARSMANQAKRFAPEVMAAGKAFAKPIPRERLDLEIQTFLTLVRDPRVLAALDTFVHSDDVRPYLP